MSGSLQNFVRTGSRVNTRDPGQLSAVASNDVAITGGAIDGVTIGGTVEGPGYFSALAVSGATRLGDGFANYCDVTGAAAGSYPILQASGSDANIDMRLLGKGTGMLNSTKLYIGSSGARSSVNANTISTQRFTTTYSGSGWPAHDIRGNLSGTLTASVNGVVNVIVDSDTVAAGVNGFDFFKVADIVKAGATGSRNAIIANVDVQADTTTTGGQYHVGLGASTYSSGSFGGAHNNALGNIFASNMLVGLSSGAGGAVNSICGLEIDVFVNSDAEAAWNVGQQIIGYGHPSRGTHASRGWNQDIALGFVNSPSVSTGWRTLLSVGATNGVWPLATDSQIFSTIATGLGSSAYAVADGIAWKDITFGRVVLETANASLDGSGNFGGQVTAGVSLQTTSAIAAKTAVVNTITVLDGGLYNATSIPTLVFSSVTGSGATATIATHGAYRVGNVNAAGSGYAVGEILTVVGGTGTAATFTVVKLTSGGTGVRSLKLLSAGNYTVVPGSGATTTSSGSGTGCTLTLNMTALTITVTGAGSGYPEFPPPTVAFTGGTVYRKLVAKVAMTATQVPLSLNPGGSVLVGTQTPASASATGTAGTIAWDSSFIYICTATNTWKRVAIATW